MRAGFDEKKNLYKRAYTELNESRKIWMDLQLNATEASPSTILHYLEALHHAANVIAGLTDRPLAERRLLLDLPDRAEKMGHPELARGFLGLLGGTELSPSSLSEWVPTWTDYFSFASEAEGVDIRIHNARQNYYKSAIAEMLKGENPLAALYPLLLTWTLSAKSLPENQITAWQNACQLLEIGESNFEGRLEGLDHYLDSIEEKIEKMVFSEGFELDEIL